MTKIRQGGYVFITWIGDHAPKHVHVYKDGRLVLTFDLSNGRVLSGAVTRRILVLIRDLEAEGKL